MWGLLSPAPQSPSWAQEAPDLCTFPLDAAFLSPQGFAKVFASIFLKTPKAEPRVEALGCVLRWGLARAAFSLKHAEFPAVPALGGNAMALWVGCCWKLEQGVLLTLSCIWRRGRARMDAPTAPSSSLHPPPLQEEGQPRRMLGVPSDGGCCGDSPAWPGAHRTQCDMGPAPFFMPSSIWLAYVGCRRSHLVSVALELFSVCR